MAFYFESPLSIADLFICVLAAIQLDHELFRGAGEVRNAIADRMLAAEFLEREFFA